MTPEPTTAEPLTPEPLIAELTPPGGFRTFLTLWATQSLSVLGSALSSFAFTIYLAQTVFPLESQKPQLALALGLTALAFTLTSIFGAPIAGAWADRHDRRRTMLACDLLSGAVTLSIGLLILLAHPPFWALIPLVAVTGLISVFHVTSFDTSYVMLVPGPLLARANGMMQTTQSLATLSSPAIAALIVGLPALLRTRAQVAGTGAAETGVAGLAGLAGWQSGVPLAYLLDAVTFLLAALVLSRLSIPSPPPEEAEVGQRRSLWADVRLGGQYIADRRALLWLLTTFTLANFVLSPLAFFDTLLVKYQLAPDAARHGLSFVAALALITTVQSGGALLGGLAISIWGGLKQRRVLGVLIPMLIGGLALALLGFSQNLLLSAVAMLLLGLCLPIPNAHSQAIWQAQVPPGLQGRVFSVRRLIAQCATPVSIALASAVTTVLPVGAVTVFLGLLLAAFCTVQLLNPQMGRVEDREALEAGAAARLAARQQASGL